MINQRTLEIIEELGKIPVSTIENLEEFRNELYELGYISYLNSSTDYLIISKED